MERINERYAFALYNRLDARDQNRIIERMRYFLEDEKYITEVLILPTDGNIIHVNFAKGARA